MEQSTLPVEIMKAYRFFMYVCLLGSSPLYSIENEVNPSKSSSPSHQPQRVLTTFIPRSQGDNTARELVGWQRKLFLCYDSNYATIASSVEYTRSFDTDCIAKHLFTTPCLTFTGSQFLTACIPGEGTKTFRNPNDLVADYFGLATDFTGTLAIKPRIENVIIDINLYFGLEDSGPGLFLWINAPIVHTRWTLGLDDCVVCSPKFRGCTQFPDCYMFSGVNTPFEDPVCETPRIKEETPRTTPNCPVNSNLNVPRTFRNANCTTQSIREALSGNFTFGDMTEPWEFGRFSFCPRSKTGLADIDVMLGWNFIQNDYGHFGLYAVTIIPTGTRPKAKYVFEPLIGDGKHWKLGAGGTAHFSLCPNTEESSYNMGIYAYGRALYAFDTDQMRSFDFKRAPGDSSFALTRYMLLKEFNTAFDYNGTIINAINFATRNCEVKVGLIGDVSVKAYVAACGWEFDIGYNFYFRSCEKVCIKTDCPCPLDSRIFGFKGLEGVCCIPYLVENVDTAPTARITSPPLADQPLKTTQPRATMFTVDLPHQEPTVSSSSNSDDLPTICLSWNSDQLHQDTPISELTPQNCFIGVSTTQPTIVTCADLDAQSAAQGEMRTNKVFGHLSYTFDSCYTPFVGIGAEGEFDAHNKNALQQWGIWIKAGASF
jgi:hypothetical protein